MKTTSNDHLPSDDNSGSYHSSSLHHTSSHHNTTANEEQIIKEKAIARIEDKIIRIKEAIKVEQIKCNDNVNEYLKLSSNADPTQNQRI
ncbi:hypothetical protein QU857_27160, partial [Escherichia coli]|nr:hypothetical protein [Escherichia coli]